ncbi:hypothetical protein H8356DRAFT_1004845 [Neocallimastix lanati (nom. inval.)]|nr:hypothetical protein H8356DRAFT_1004845 [Neocallimastix sp. JGI-2020a]
MKMEDLSPFLSNKFMASLYQNIEKDYSKEKLNDIVKQMINYYILKQKNIILNIYLKKKNHFPYSCLEEEDLKKTKIDDKTYKDLLITIRNIDKDNPIFDKEDIDKIKSIDGFISSLRNFKTLDAFKQSITLKNIYTIPKKPILGMSSDEPSIIKLGKIQEYLNQLGYNNLGIPFFEINKASSYNSLMKIAKLMINTGLPIKCLEATVLGIYLTNSLPLVERFSISFKSELDYKICRHIVLAVKIRGKYGAIGLSRKDDLHWKKPIYKTLKELILEYKKSYQRHNHNLIEIKLGYKIPHEIIFNDRIIWKYAIIKCNDKNWLTAIDDIQKTL